MPEHDTYDLDAAFAALERDIVGMSHAPGADRAVATAGHRRQTRRASLAAVIALATIGTGAAVVHGHGDASPEPAGRPLPTPAPLTAQGIDDATRGWTGHWRPVGSDTTSFVRRQVDVGCRFLVQDQTVAQPTRVGNSTFLSTDHSQLVEFRAGMRGTEGASQEYDATVAAFDACPGHAERVFSYSHGAEVTVASLPGTQGSEVVSVATRYADRASLLLLGRVDAAPTAAQAGPLAELTLAATMADATYSEVMPSSGAGRIDPAQSAGQVWAEAIEPALTGWSTPWNPQLPQDASQQVPDLALPACAGTPEGDDQGNGLTVNVGRDGFEWVHWFVTEARATQAVADLTHSLARCSPAYDVHEVTLPGGRPVVVASGPRVLWFTRVASHVLALQLPAGDTPPPDAVSRQVGAVLEHVLEQPATTTVSPGDQAPGWMKKEIAAAPTFGP
jgi:hypothetical protein